MKRKTLILISFFLLPFILNSCFFKQPEYPITDEYDHYIEYYGNLRYLELEENPFAKSERLRRLFAIPGVSKDSFIVVRTTGLLGGAYQLYKNPEYIIEPINDLTIKSISLTSSSAGQEASIEHIVIKQTSLFEKFKLTTTFQTQKLVPKTGWSDSILGYKLNNGIRKSYSRLNIKVRFYEYENIIWASTIYHVDDGFAVSISGPDGSTNLYYLDSDFYPYIEEIITELELTKPEPNSFIP